MNSTAAVAHDLRKDIFGTLAPGMADKNWELVPLHTKLSADSYNRRKNPEKPVDSKTPCRLWRNPERYEFATGDETKFKDRGIGLQCGVGKYPIVGVDIDIPDLEEAEKVSEGIQAILGPAPLTRRGRKGMLLVYRAEKPGWKKRIAKIDDDNAIEFLGDGQYFAAFGEHPVGDIWYQWDLADVLDADPSEVEPSALPEVTFEQLQRAHAEFHREEVRERKEQSGEGLETMSPPVGIDIDRARELLAYMDPEDRDEWLKVGFALHHESGGEWLDVWDEWSQKSEKYREGECGEIWGDAGKPENAITMRSIIKTANERKAEAEAKERERLFAEVKKQIEDSEREDVLLSEIAQRINDFENNGTREALKSAVRARFKKLTGSTLGIKQLEKTISKPESPGMTADEISQKVLERLGPDDLLCPDSGVHLYNEDLGIWELRPAHRFQADVQKQLRSIMPCFTNRHVTDTTAITRREIDPGPGYFDKHEDDVVVVANGVLRLEHGEWKLYPHSRENYATVAIPIIYEASAKAPLFEQFLDEVFQGDEDAGDKKQALIELMGYTMMQHAGRFERFCIMIGGGRNGKSVVLKILYDLLGERNCAAVQPHLFGNQFHRAFLHRRLANIVTELQAGKVIEDASLKAVVSGEPMNVAKKNQDPFDMIPYCTCWFGTNHMPHTRDFSDAMFRRPIILKFNRQFKAGVNANPALKTSEYWRDEMPGILNLALEAYAGVVRHKDFTEPASSKEAKKEWRLEADQVAQFVELRAELDPTAKIQSSELYAAFSAWAKFAGIRMIVSQREFSNRLKRLGFEDRREGAGVFIHGLNITREDFDLCS